MGMAWRKWEGIKTLHFPIFHPEQASKPVRTAYTTGRKTGIGEK